MSSRQRTISALERRGFDRIPVYHEGTPKVNAPLRKTLGAANDVALGLAPGDDWRYVAPEYEGPAPRTFEDGSQEGLWGERYVDIGYGDGLGTYPEAVYLPFAGMDDPSELEGYPFPRADWYDYGTIAQQCLIGATMLSSLAGRGVSTS